TPGPGTPDEDAGGPGATSPDARLFSAAIAVHSATADDRSWLTIRGDGRTGARSGFARLDVEAGTTIPHGTRREWRLRAGGAAVSQSAARMVWPGAGAGHARGPLLRAHDLVRDDLIAGPAFGRQLVHATVEHR